MQILNMHTQLLLFISFFLPLVLCDNIKINSPTRNQVINNSSFLIDYIVERNDNNSKLVITNSTTELLDVRGNSLVSFSKNFTNSTMVRLNMMTFVQPNTVTNFTVKITAFGKYDVPQNGKLFGELELEVPLQLNLSNSTNTTTTSTRPTSTVSSSVSPSPSPTSTSTSNSTTTNASASSSATPTSKSESMSINKTNLVMGLTSFLVLFLI